MTRRAGARLFVALDPPSAVREELVAWARQALRGPRQRDGGAPGSVRVLDAELLHLTLCFLGSRPVEEIAAVGEAVRRSSGSVGELSIGAPLWLPRRHPRALAVEVHDDPHGGLEALQRSLLASLADACGFREERSRRFRAHITLARIGGRTQARAKVRAPAVVPLQAVTPALSFRPETIVLYRSWLSPAGASYEALASGEL